MDRDQSDLDPYYIVATETFKKETGDSQQTAFSCDLKPNNHAFSFLKC